MRTPGAGAADSAGVPIPPPLIFLATYGAAVLLHALVALPAPGGFARPAGAAIVLLAAVPLGWALLGFVRANVNPIPTRPVDSLVLDGPYRYTRNPMYLGMLLLYVGVALITGLTWALLLVPGLVLIVNRVVIRREEAYLTRRFGEAYTAYLGRVRRWI